MIIIISDNDFFRGGLRPRSPRRPRPRWSHYFLKTYVLGRPCIRPRPEQGQEPGRSRLVKPLSGLSNYNSETYCSLLELFTGVFWPRLLLVIKPTNCSIIEFIISINFG